MTTQLINPVANTKEYKDLVEEYKKNLLKYQPGVKWYFGGVEKGINFHGKFLTINDMVKLVKRTSPIGPKTEINEIEDITPSHEKYCELIKKNGYNDYLNWIENQVDVFYYSRGKEDFSVWEGLKIASKLGYKKIIFENLS